MLNKLKGYKTFLFFFATALLGVVTMIEAADIQAILLPLVCQVTDVTVDPGSACVTRVVAIAGAILTFVGVVGKVLRMVTNSAMFKPDPDSERGSAGLVILFIVMLAGLSGNAYNAAQDGKPIESVSDVKAAVVQSYDGRVADYSRLNQ